MGTKIQSSNLAVKDTDQVDFRNLIRSDDTFRVEAVMGTLGSGKTSLIQALQSQYDLSHVEVIENDIGKADFDASFLNSCGMRVVALRAGCICCQDLTSLSLSLQEFAASNDSRTSAVIIEPTGVAEPEKIRELLVDLGIVFEVTIMVNVKDFEMNLKAGRLKGHFEAADKILFSWWDHMDEAEFADRLSSILAYKNTMNPDVPIAFITRSGEVATIDPSLLIARTSLSLSVSEDASELPIVHGKYHRSTVGLREDLTMHDIRSFVASLNSQGINVLRMKGTLPDFSFHVVGNDIRVAEHSSNRLVTDLITDASVPQWLIDSIRVIATQGGQALDAQIIAAQEKIVASLKFPSTVVSKSGLITSEFEADEGWNYVDNPGFSTELREDFYRQGVALKCLALEQALAPERRSDPNLGYYLKRLGGALTWFVTKRYSEIENLGFAERISALNPATQYFSGLALIKDRTQLGGVSAGDPAALVDRMQRCEAEIGLEEAGRLFRNAYENIIRLDKEQHWGEMLDILRQRCSSASA